MNKKLLFLILLGGVVLLLPNLAFGGQLTDILKNIEDLVWNVFVTVVIIMWIVTGILFLTAMGSPEKLKTAKLALLAATAGTIIGILAFSAQEIIQSEIIK